MAALWESLSVRDGKGGQCRFPDLCQWVASDAQDATFVAIAEGAVVGYNTYLPFYFRGGDPYTHGLQSHYRFGV